MKTRRVLLGTPVRMGLLEKIGVVFLLCVMGFVFIYPLFYMLTYSLMDAADLRDPLVTYLPARPTLDNYASAAKVLNFFPALASSLYVSLLPTVAQSVACCVTAYGLARFRFPGKNLILALVVVTFVLPPVITMLPQFLMFKKMNLIGSPLTFALPALVGQGLRSSIIILVFYQILRALPPVLEEAATIDGAGAAQLFFKIALPLCVPGFVIAFLFSLTWYWNEVTLTTTYMGGALSTLPMQLERFAMIFDRMFGTKSGRGGKSINRAIYLAGTMLSISPLLIFYFFTQKQFIQSVDRSGITGE